MGAGEVYSYSQTTPLPPPPQKQRERKMNETHSSISRRWKRKHYWLQSKLRNREEKRVVGEGVPGKKQRGVREGVWMQAVSSPNNPADEKRRRARPQTESPIRGQLFPNECLLPLLHPLKTKECTYKGVRGDGMEPLGGGTALSLTIVVSLFLSWDTWK